MFLCPKDNLPCISNLDKEQLDASPHLAVDEEFY